MELNELLIPWYLKENRELPWRKTKDPYKIWLSEIILQQTRVDQGLPYYLRFVNTFPSVGFLSDASEDEVLKNWQGLGYYSRARNLHYTAKYIYRELNGKFPDTYDEIRKLKGVGPYTAAAIASFAFGLPYAVLDGNVARVLSRIFNVETAINTTKGKKELEKLAEACLDENQPDTYNQAIMELGALICTPKKPRCMLCPVQEKCRSFELGNQHLRPIKEKKAKPRPRKIDYAVIENEGHYIFRKRTEDDIWKGLYDFASLEEEEEVTEITMMKFAEKTFPHFKIKEVDALPRKSYTHLLSHRRIKAYFWHLRVEGVQDVSAPYKSVKKEKVHEVAVPRLIHRFLDETKII